MQVKNPDLFALEIENPYLKNDLIRMKDKYEEVKGYESLKSTRSLTKKDIIFKIPKIRKINKIFFK